MIALNLIALRALHYFVVPLHAECLSRYKVASLLTLGKSLAHYGVVTRSERSGEPWVRLLPVCA